MKSIQLLLVAFCCPILLFSQDIKGLWTGTLYNDSTKQEHNYEVGITMENGKYVGYSHTCFYIDQNKYFGLKKVKVRIASDGKVIIEDGALLLNDYPIEAHKNVRQLNVLDLTSNTDQEILVGDFITNRTKTYAPLTGKVKLKKNDNAIQSDLVSRLQQLGTGLEQAFLQQSSEPFVINN